MEKQEVVKLMKLVPGDQKHNFVASFEDRATPKIQATRRRILELLACHGMGDSTKTSTAESQL